MRKLIPIAALLLLVGCMQTKQVEILSNQKDTLECPCPETMCMCLESNIDLSDTMEFYRNK